MPYFKDLQSVKLFGLPVAERCNDHIRNSLLPYHSVRHTVQHLRQQEEREDYNSQYKIFLSLYVVGRTDNVIVIVIFQLWQK
jgi:hypothetical protein